jgi:HD superfamily phosphodiesterase
LNKSDIIAFAEKVERDLGAFCSCGGLGLHGFDHLGRVAILAGRLARAVGEDVESAVVMGFLHDSARKDDGGGCLHAIESAVLARKLLLEFYPQMDRGRICDSIKRHADGETTSDLMVACLWDADRLELKRLGRVVDPDLLSTEIAKRLARKRKPGKREEIHAANIKGPESR